MQKVDNTIHWINIFLYVDIAQLVSLLFIHWIVIYPVDSTIQRMNKMLYYGGRLRKTRGCCKVLVNWKLWITAF